VRHDFDLVAADLGDGNGVAQVAGAAIDLDALREELLEGGDIEDFVRNGLGAVDGVLLHAELATGEKGKEEEGCTFLVTLVPFFAALELEVFCCLLYLACCSHCARS